MSTSQSSSRGLTLSVGIPTLNQANYLAETLDSLLSQTRPPDEILVSDHHSTDDTQQVLSRYASRFPNLRIVQPPPGSNLTAQYNFTLSSLTGDWLTMVSSDDIARPNFCETLLRGASSTPDAAVVRAGWENIDSAGKVTSTHYILSVPHIQAPPDNLTAQKHGPTVNFAAFAIKREAFHQSGPILGSLQSLSDWALFLQLAPFGSFVYEHALISGYRVGHDGNKNRDRVAAWTHDQWLIFTEVMPLAAQRCGMGAGGNSSDLTWISDANRYNFIRYLARASREFASHERAPVVAHFEPWANSLAPRHSAEAAAALRAFAAGEITRTSLPLSRRAKNLIRPVLQRFHTVFRRS